VALPSPESLSLREAVAFVCERRGCSKQEAKEALPRAGLDGRLVASGSIPLSAHPNPVVRKRHPARRREDLRSDDWANGIDWTAGTVGPYSSVLIKRASIEAWLGVPPVAQSAPVKPAPDGAINREIRAEYDRAEAATRKPPNLKEIVQPVQRELLARGLQASGKRIQELAGADEFKMRRRPPGPTVRRDKRRD
jgi:hypothetical protein